MALVKEREERERGDHDTERTDFERIWAGYIGLQTRISNFDNNERKESHRIC